MSPASIKQIVVGCSRQMIMRTAAWKPDSASAAQHNIPFVTAAAFFFDLRDPSVWQESIVEDARIKELMARTTVEVDSEINHLSERLESAGTPHYGGA